jgi:hypothetical protein
MNEQDLRDCFAMFALLGIVFAHKGEDAESASLTAYKYADAMLEARNKNNEEVELGIAAFKPKKRAFKKDNGM